MKYRTLGKTDLQVSEIGFGCWAIGGYAYGPVDDKDSILALETALDRGVNFFDTADTYGEGHSEEILSRVIKKRKQDNWIIATKVGHDFYHGKIKKNFEPEYIRFACEQSLKRLGVETIDIYQLHNPSLDIIRKGVALKTLAELKQEGKIRHIGVSVFGEDVALACLRDSRVETLQVLFNLIDQSMSFRIFPEAKQKKIGIIVREPLACGLLADKYTVNSTFQKDDHRNGWGKEYLKLELKKTGRIKNILATKRLTLPQAALEYVLEYDSVSTVIPGCKTRQQVLENVRASEEPLLRSQEASLLRDLYQRDSVFRQISG